MQRIFFLGLLFFFLELNAQDSIQISVDFLYYQNSGELFIEMPQKRSLQDVYIDLPDKYGIVIEDDHFEARRKLPSNIMKNYSPTDTTLGVLIFDSNNNMLCEANFKQFEFLESIIEAAYVVSYESECQDLFESPSIYTISSNAARLLSDQFYNFEKNQEIIKKEKIVWNSIVELNMNDEFNVRVDTTICIKVNDKPFCYNLIMLDKGMEGNTILKSYVYDLTDDKPEQVFYKEDYWGLYKIQPVPIIKNDKPIFLFEIGYAEGDYISSALGYFSGENIQLSGTSLKFKSE